MNIDSVTAALSGLGILWVVFALFLLVAPLAIWIHAARAASAARKCVALLERVADAQERIAMRLPAGETPWQAAQRMTREREAAEQAKASGT